MSEEKLLRDRITTLELQLLEYTRTFEALEAAGFDVWENNFATGETYNSNTRVFKSLGYHDDEIPHTLEELFTFVHPDDLTNALALVQEHFDKKTDRYQAEMRIRAKDGSWRWIGNYGKVVERNEKGDVTRFIGVNFDINQRRIIEEALVEKNKKLQNALDHIKTLQGIIPICSYCKKIRTDQGYWDQVEAYISKHTDAEFSHSVCPECFEKHHPRNLKEL